MREKSNIVTSLPEEILSEILKHAASNSVYDFVNAKLSCKAFLRASSYDYIFENLSMENYCFIPWYQSEEYFQKRCLDANNAEALYRKGMVDCFYTGKPEPDMYYLKKAMEKGHVEAIYTYGIILICFGGELRKLGLQVVSRLAIAKSNKRSLRIIEGCRSKTDRFLKHMWVHTLVEPKQISCRCDFVKETPKCTNPIDRNWLPRSNLETCCEACFWATCCDSCLWDREAILFCNLLKEYRAANPWGSSHGEETNCPVSLEHDVI